MTDYNVPEVKEHVRGLSKLTEETGELLQLLGKLNVFPSGVHPDGKGQLYDRIAEELADVEAAILFFKSENHIFINPQRVANKLAKFQAWF